MSCIENIVMAMKEQVLGIKKKEPVQKQVKFRRLKDVPFSQLSETIQSTL